MNFFYFIFLLYIHKYNVMQGIAEQRNLPRSLGPLGVSIWLNCSSWFWLCLFVSQCLLGKCLHILVHLSLIDSFLISNYLHSIKIFGVISNFSQNVQSVSFFFHLWFVLMSISSILHSKRDFYSSIEIFIHLPLQIFTLFSFKLYWISWLLTDPV